MAQKKLHVLIVEDMSSVSEALRLQLAKAAEHRHLDLEIHIADNKQKACELLETHAFAVISLDGTFPARSGEPVRMEDIMRGAGLYRKIELMSVRPQVLFYAGYDNDMISDHLELAGCTDRTKHPPMLRKNAASTHSAWAKTMLDLIPTQQV